MDCVSKTATSSLKTDLDIKKTLYDFYKIIDMPYEKKRKFFRHLYHRYKKKPNKKIFKKLQYFAKIPFLTQMTHVKSSIDKLFLPSRLIMVEQLKAKKHLLIGDFITKKNSYEKDFCQIMGWECLESKDPKSRYYDCTNHFSCIELKKGQGMMWFDMVRYAEIFLGKGIRHTVTLYIDYNKKKGIINEMYVIPTSKLLVYLGMDHQKASMCLRMFDQVPRGLNMQASAYKKDLRQMAARII